MVLRDSRRVFLALVMMAMPFAIDTATPASAAGVLTLSAVSGSAGGRILLSGTGFAPGEQVQPYWDYGTTDSVAQKSFYLYNPIVNADGTGTANTDIFLPVTTGGAHTISLVGLTTGIVDTAAFLLLPRLDTGSHIAPPGTTLAFSGWNLGAREAVSITWNGAPVAKASTDSHGTFSGKTAYTIPASTPIGTYIVTATGATSHLSASANVAVGAVPTGPSPGADDWAQWGFDQQQHRVNAVESAFSGANVAQVGLVWQAKIGGPDSYQASPSVANGMVYVGSIHGLVSAYSESTGVLVWSYQAPGPVYASPTIVNGIVYFGTVNEPQETQAGNYAIALNAQTGAVVWSDPLSNGGEWTAPLVSNGVAYFTMANREAVSGGMVAVDALSGSKLWQTNTPYGIWAQPSLDPSGRYLYQGTGNPCFTQSNPLPGDGCSGYVIKVNVADGSYTILLHTPDFSGDDDVATAVSYDNGNLYFGGKDGYFYSMSASTGSVNWILNTGFSGDGGIYSSGAVYNGRIFFGSMGSHQIWAVNEADGSVAWKYDTGNEVAASPVVAGGMVWAASYSKKFVALDPVAGGVVWTTTLDASSGGSPAVANGMIFQTVGNGALNAYTVGAQVPQFVSGASLTGYSGTRLSKTITVTGLPGPTMTETGALPAGVVFSPGPFGGSATLSGTPAVGTQGSYPVVLTAQNASGTTTQNFTLNVLSAAPVFTSAGSDTLTAGQPFTFPVTATGVPTPTLFATSGTVPAGVTFVDNGLGNGTISGTPAAAGVYTVVLNAHNSAGPNAVQNFVLTVNPAPSPPVFSADSPPSLAPLGGLYSYQFTASGVPAPTFAVASGTLPSGLALDPNTGIVAGSATGLGAATFTVSASNGVGSPALTPPITITVTSQPVFTSPATVTATAGQPFSFTVTTAGTPTSTVAAVGALPTGVTFAANSDGTATLAGTPASGQEGTYPLTLTAVNGVGPNATETFTLVVAGQPPVFVADTPPTAAGVNQPYGYTFVASGDPAPTFGVATGALPAGLSLDPVSGILSGTPTTPGASTFSVAATNGSNPPAVSPPITVTVAAGTDMSVSLTGPKTATAGSTITYTVTVNDLGPVTATAIAVAFTLPAGTTFVSAQNGWTYTNGVISWTVPSLASGAHTNLKLSLTTGPAGTEIAGASAFAANPDPNPANNTTTFTTTVR